MSYSGQFYGSDPDERDSVPQGRDDDVQDAEVLGETAGPKPRTNDEAIVANVDGAAERGARRYTVPDSELGEGEVSDGSFVRTRVVREVGWWLAALLPFLIIVVRMIATPGGAGTRWFPIFITLPLFLTVVVGAMVGTQFATVGKRLTRIQMLGTAITTVVGVVVFYAFSPYLADKPELLPGSYDGIALAGFVLAVIGFILWLGEMRKAAQTIPDILAL